MVPDYGLMELWLEIAVLFASLAATAFPVLYSLGPWYKDPLGRALMLKAVAFALAVDLTAVMHFFPPSSILVIFWANLLVFAFIAIATSWLTWMLWKYNFITNKEDGPMETKADYNPKKEPKPLVGDGVYKVLRRLVEYVLPAAGALYFSLAQIWGLPYAEQVVGTIAATTVFLAACVHVSRKAYDASDAKYDGKLEVNTLHPDRDTYSLDLGEELENLGHKDEVVLKVNKLTE